MRSVIARTLLDGSALLNLRQFFEAHEVWEDGWRKAEGEDRLLLHGLIQVAAGFHKLECGQPAGAVALLSRGAEKLATVGQAAAGRLDLRTFLASVETCRETARRMAQSGIASRDPADLPAFPTLPSPPWRLFSGAIHTRIEIAAEARRVWNVLIDFGAYPEWNPFLRAIGGEARAGTRLSVEAHLPGRGVMKFCPRVLRAEPRRELRWRDRSPIPGLFDGEHVFSIARLAADRVRFSQREMFSGFLVPVLRRTHLDATRHGFEEMNAALKARIEP